MPEFSLTGDVMMAYQYCTIIENSWGLESIFETNEQSKSRRVDKFEKHERTGRPRGDESFINNIQTL